MPRPRPLLTLAAALGCAALLSSCGEQTTGVGAAVTASTVPPRTPVAVGTPGPGFLTPSAPPSPEATITPSAGSWDTVHPPRGYRVVLLSYGADRQTAVLRRAVAAWAGAEGVRLNEVTPSGPDDFVPSIQRAAQRHPDLVISAGNELVDALAAQTPGWFEQSFLVLGAEVAEPTQNVTAADWAGASFRGEGLGASSAYDPASFTPERAGRAVRAGVAAVLTGWTGIVVWLS